MSNYTVIADVGEAFAEMLRSRLVPDLIPNRSGVALRSPGDKEDIQLGIFLYDVRESEEIRRAGMGSVGASRQSYPPIYLNLYYMITAYSKGDIKFRMSQEQKILGAVLQQLHDNSFIEARQFGEKDGDAFHLQIELLRMDMDEKNKIWNFGGVPYKLSLFYKISPVVLDSARTREISRVNSFDVNYHL